MKKRTAIMLRLDQDTVEKLDKIAEKQLRSRTNQALLFIVEGVERYSTGKYQKVSDLKAEMEQRANQPTEDTQKS